MGKFLWNVSKTPIFAAVNQDQFKDLRGRAEALRRYL